MSEQSAIVERLLGYLAAAAAVTAYAAWLVACPWTRWMLLPLVFGVTFAILWARRSEAFFRRMAGTCLLGGVAVSAAPTIHLAFVSPHGSGAFKFTNENVLLGLGMVAIGGLFGVLEYFRARDASRPPPDGPLPGNVVNVTGGSIGTQNVVFGNQANTYVSNAPAEVDTLLSQIKILLRNGLTKEAGDTIADLEGRLWGRMDQAQKARLRAQRACVKLAAGDTAGAARDFIESHELNPTDERGLAHRQGLRPPGNPLQVRSTPHVFTHHYLIQGFQLSSAPLICRHSALEARSHRARSTAVLDPV